jgi:chromosomal replication initiation ATPase DnaA
MSSQLVLPLGSTPSMTRAGFIAGPGNAQALAFIDVWPDWPVAAAALYGPPGSGKTHLVSAWRERSGAEIVSAASLTNIGRTRPLVIEDVDSIPPNHARDSILFALIEGAARERPVLLTGHEPPAAWASTLPDLASRFSAMLAFPLWTPDEGLLARLARKLFADRQLAVPDPVIDSMILSLERTPAAIRQFVAEADAKALAEGRAVNLSLVRELVALRESGLP